jgi:hypothetical protein
LIKQGAASDSTPVKEKEIVAAVFASDEPESLIRHDACDLPNH